MLFIRRCKLALLIQLHLQLMFLLAVGGVNLLGLYRESVQTTGGPKRTPRQWPVRTCADPLHLPLGACVLASPP